MIHEQMSASMIHVVLNVRQSCCFNRVVLIYRSEGRMRNAWEHFIARFMWCPLASSNAMKKYTCVSSEKSEAAKMHVTAVQVYVLPDYAMAWPRTAFFDHRCLHKA